MSTAKTPAVHPLTALSKDWLAYVIGTRTEEGAIEVISMALERKAAENARMRAALEAMLEAADAIGSSQGEATPEEEALFDSRRQAREVLASLTT